MSGSLDTGFILDLTVVLATLVVGAYVVAAPPHGAATRLSFLRARVIGFIALGLLLSLAWVRLAAIDVALTEAAIGGAATGLLLLRAAAILPASTTGDGAKGRHGITIVAALLGALVAFALATVVLSLPAQGPSLAAPVADDLAAFGLENPVTAVLLGYRAVDTLLEKIVLVLAVIGVWSLARDEDWGGAPATPFGGSSEAALALLSRTLPPIGVVFGIYLVWTGADEPGGTFQGGAILAGMWLLAMMSGATSPPRTDSRRLRQALVAGPALFLLVGALGVPMAGAFLAYPVSIAKPLIILVEVVLTVSIAAMVALLVLGPARERRS